MFTFLGRIVASYPWLICSLWLILGIGVSCVAPPWAKHAHDDDIRFLPDRCPSVRGYQLLQEAFPRDVFASRIVFAVERQASRLTDEDLALVDEMVADLEKMRKTEPGLQINRVYSYRDPLVGKKLLSKDGQCTLIQVSLGTPYLAMQTRTTVDRAEAALRERLDQYAQNDEGLALYITGPAGIGRDLTNATEDSLEKTTLATIVLVIVILLMVYRSPVLALIPLITIACSVWVALKLLALCTLIPGFYLLDASKLFVIVLLYGAGTDYCLFLMSRYREEFTRDRKRTEALIRSIGSVGAALAASAGTVICGLSMMGLAEFAKVRCGGPAIGISLAIALVASLTLAPALLQIMGRWVFWPLGMPERKAVVGATGLWGWLSQQVVRRPGLIWVTAVLVLAPLAWLGCQVKTTYRATDELSRTSSGVEGLEVIKKHFPAGEVGPITVLLESTTDWNSPEGRAALARLSKGFGYLPGVAEVRSLTQPLGEPLPEPVTSRPVPRQNSLFGSLWGKVVQGVEDQVRTRMRDHYAVQLPASNVQGEPTQEGIRVAPRHVTRLDVILDTDPFQPESLPGLKLVETWLQERLPETMGDINGVRGETYGITVNARDLASVVESDRMRINVLVLAGIFLILLMLVRRPGLAAYLLITVLFSYFATLGATTLAAHLWEGRPLGEVDWRVPFFLFIILVAVGEDYNILLISRALQERRRHGGVEGTRRALAHTGGTITSCGLIMAGTFATLMLGGLNTLIQIGFALAFGVLLDTFVVRPFLVPAYTAWAWRNDQPAVARPRRRKSQAPAVVTLPIRRPPLRKAG